MDHMVSTNPSVPLHGTINVKLLAASVFVYLFAETPQPFAFPHTTPSGLPDWPQAQQPRRGAAPAGPGPQPAGRSSAGRLGSETGQPLGLVRGTLQIVLLPLVSSCPLCAGLLHEGDQSISSEWRPVPRVAFSVAPVVVLVER